MNRLTDQEVERLRREFPALERLAYFTTNGLGILPRRSADALGEQIRALSESGIASALFENPPLLARARRRAARLLGCDPEELAFCRNTSEGVLWAASSFPFRPDDEVLVPQGEYPANVLPWMAQESRGVATHLLDQKKRRITPQMVADAWSERARILAVSFVQYDSGFRADLSGLAEVVHERGGLLFCDAIQGLGALRLDVREAGVDLLAAGTHKWLLGLQGLGLFYCSRDAFERLAPTHVASGSLVDDRDPPDPRAPYDRNWIAEARRFEEGTRNYLGMAALSESLGLIEEVGIERIESRIRELTNALVAEVEKRGCRVESPRGPGEWSGIVLFAPPQPGPDAQEIVASLHRQGVAINAREGCIHMGVHFYNTRAEIDRVLAALDGRD
ncbi:aminotransferase class V-fold PLP-dependent enzyme [bacterium]|nr:aminotransferase class V-fold PLP-dependent enzyme [bacterium]